MFNLRMIKLLTLLSVSWCKDAFNMDLDWHDINAIGGGSRDFPNTVPLFNLTTGINWGPYLNSLASNNTLLLFGVSMATSLLTLAAFSAVTAVLFSLLGKYKKDSSSGYDTYGFNPYYNMQGGSSYSSYRSFVDPNRIDWESISILDTIGVLTETYQKFEPSNIECQKRFICDIHRNTQELGRFASTIVNLFSYLTYARIFALPYELKYRIDEYLEAADKGLGKKDCGKLYDDCRFSVQQIADNYGLIEENKANRI